MAALWSAPFFRAKKSDGADNSLRRLTNDIIYFRIWYNDPVERFLHSLRSVEMTVLLSLRVKPKVETRNPKMKQSINPLP